MGGRPYIVLLTKSRTESIRIGYLNGRLVGSDSDSDACIEPSGYTFRGKDNNHGQRGGGGGGRIRDVLTTVGRRRSAYQSDWCGRGPLLMRAVTKCLTTSSSLGRLRHSLQSDFALQTPDTAHYSPPIGYSTLSFP